MMNKEGLSKKFWIVAVSICALLFFIVTILFIAFFNRKPEIVDENKKGGQVVLNYTTTTNVFSILDATPMTDDLGVKQLEEGKYFDFSVDVSLKDANEVQYEISLKKDKKNSNILDKDIKIYLEKEDSGTYVSALKPHMFSAEKKTTDIGTKKGNMILYRVTTKKKEVDNYRLRMWLSDQSLMTVGNYSVTINVSATAK